MPEPETPDTPGDPVPYANQVGNAGLVLYANGATIGRTGTGDWMLCYTFQQDANAAQVPVATVIIPDALMRRTGQHMAFLEAQRQAQANGQGQADG